ncbi:hypothetical protein SKAU_G00123610 [Synaphobranchus kaupii]|uniref:Axin-2 n=1 Tax=Synaphobranchus kaupii TaxID=118154 RepID=A0A9Q1J2S1_SYNKA|nr:hypothetical protein SKAU_G00123610 [Synaphobranchus kaupii]
MFDQAQTEIQSTMEENSYQMFLTSDIYLEYVRTGCENPAYVNHNGLGSLKLMCGYLPTLNEEEEWNCSDLKAKALASVVGLSAKALRATASIRTAEVLENGYRSHRHGDPTNPYHVNSGYVFAPATSANDSEISSDAMTDDSMSMTDSSVDGIPPYKLGTKKQQQREMHRSVKMNGQVPLPHFPRTHRLPKEMTPVEPAAFAAELIARLEKLKRERETMSSLEERLQQIQEEEERDESEVPGSTPHHPSHPLGLLPSGSLEEDPQAILDEHLSRVLKTPGCQSPGVVRHSPRSRSPDQHPLLLVKPLPGPALGSYPLGCGVGKAFLPKQSTKHIHHHYIHHHAGPKSKEQIEVEAAQRVQCLCPGGGDYSSYHKCRSHGKEQCGSPAECALGRPSALSKRPSKASEGGGPAERRGRGVAAAPPRSSPRMVRTARRTYGSGSWRARGRTNTSRTALKVSRRPTPRTRPPRRYRAGRTRGEDPAMPPLPPPNTLAQLEEACRRLEEVSKPPKQRHSTSSLQRDRSHSVAFQSGNAPLSSPALQTEESKEPKKQAAAHGALGTELVVTYFFCGEKIPYRRMMKTHSLTLGHFKEQLRKKGNYRYYFKKASDEFECGAVFEEVWDDGAVLPMYEGKVLGKVERMD